MLAAAAQAVVGGEDDLVNRYPNVGAFMPFAKASNRLAILCSGTLIHPRVFLTAGHCAEGPTDGTTIDDYIAVVSFRNIRPRDAPGTWVPIVGSLTHPSYPRNGRGGSLIPSESDVGVLLLGEPVRTITPAQLPAPGEFDSLSGRLMTLVGYGCDPGDDGWNGSRSFGGTVGNAINGEWGQFTPASAYSCAGDSGGPILHEGRVILITSGGGNGFAYPARIDAPAVLSWLAKVIESVSGPPATTLDLNQHGLTGSWYQPSTDGQGIEIEVYPNLVAPGTGLLQGSWFTFDYAAPGGAPSQRWYTFSGNVQTGQTSATPLTLYQNVGGNFNALPITSAVQVGTVLLSVADCMTATMAYTFTDGSARSGSIPLVRLTPNVTCSASGTTSSNADFGYSGNWFDPATAGQGFVFEVNPNAPAVFFAWYTYAPNGQSQGAAGQRWYTGLASYTPNSRTLPVTLYETTGGLFNSVMPASHTVAVGKATATFSSCNAAQLTFNFTGGSSAGSAGTINLSRIGPVPAGCGS